MAVLFPEQKAILLLAPKTGSKWVRWALERASIPHRIVDPSGWRDHGTLAVHGRDFRFIGSFVRNPIDWYRSYWAFRVEHNWNSTFLIDQTCQDSDFKQFVRKAVTKIPGIVTTLFQSYVGEREHEIHFVGRQERLGADLNDWLRLIGVAACGKWDTGKRINQSKALPDVTPDLVDLIVFSELEAMLRYGYLNDYRDSFGLFALIRKYPKHRSSLRDLCLWTERTHWEPDDLRVRSGHPRSPGTRYARLMGNFALYLWSILQDTKLATEYFEAALQYDPEHPRTLGNYAVFRQLTLRDLDGANALFLRALSVRPEHAYNLGNYAYFLDRELHAYDRARPLYEKALVLNDKLPRNLTNYASCLASLGGLTQQADECFRRALVNEPHSRHAWLEYGQFLERLGRRAEAKEAYVTALSEEMQ